MFNYGQGFSYSCGGHTLGSGYGQTQMVSYPSCGRSSWTLVLVLFIILVLFGLVLGC
ncbi:MAG: hypothetical protein FWE07_07775 [Turicibacter sp.]|nr:hypothetical protein [Turicibacter sp.]